MSSCKLVIRDEVNIKIEGLPVEIRRKLSNAFKYEIPYARYHPAYKLGRWDGSVTLFGMGGNGYINQLPRILEILEKSGVEVEEIEDLRNSVAASSNETCRFRCFSSRSSKYKVWASSNNCKVSSFGKLETNRSSGWLPFI